MPSIRVKGATYRNLREVLDNNNPPNPVAQDPSLRQEAESRLPSQSRRKSMPELQAENDKTDALPASPTINSPILPAASPTRPRANTTSSRVHAHCVINPRRNSRALQFVAAANRSASSITDPLRPNSATHLSAHRNGVLTMEGTQANVLLTSNGDPGILETTFSLPDTESGDRDSGEFEGHHHDDIVEHLDVIDSQVGTVSSLTNAANSIIIPPLSWYSRKPVIVLSSPTRAHMDSEEGSQEHQDALDRHVDDVLKRPSKFRRTMLGVWSFLKTPMGILTGIYGFLVVFWGAAIVFFLAKMINFHNANTQGFWVEVSSQVVTGLFTVTSIGLIPSRVLDTYRIWKIWSYKRKTIKRRKAAGLPQLFDVDDLPDPAYDPNYVHVLTEAEQKDLHRQQVKFQYHQTWYRAHGTETHRAFPINSALWICFLNDGNSIFQIFLCGTMWGMNRFQRPAWSTGILIPSSFLCGIGAAVMIWKGGEKTKRVEEVRERLRAALAAEHPEKIPSKRLSETRHVVNDDSPLRRDTNHKIVTNAASQDDDGAVNVEEYMMIPKKIGRN